MNNNVSNGIIMLTCLNYKRKLFTLTVCNADRKWNDFKYIGIICNIFEFFKTYHSFNVRLSRLIIGYRVSCCARYVVLYLVLSCETFCHGNKNLALLVLSVTVFVLDIVHNYNVDLMLIVFVYDDECSTVHV